MSFLNQIFRDAEPGGGAAGTGTGDGSDTAGKNAGAGAGAEDSSTKDGGTQDKKASDDQKKPDTEPTLDELKAEVGRKEKLIQDLKKKEGEQSKVIGDFRKLEKNFERDAAGTVKALAGKYGLRVDLGEKANPVVELLKAIDAGSDEEALKKLVQGMHDQTLEQKYEQMVDDKTRPAIELMTEHGLATKYPDYDKLADVRTLLRMNTKMGSLTQVELLHLAARGFSLPEAIEDAKKQGRAEYEEELRNKNEGLVDDGGKGKGTDAGDKGKNVTKFSEVVRNLPFYPAQKR